MWKREQESHPRVDCRIVSSEKCPAESLAWSFLNCGSWNTWQPAHMRTLHVMPAFDCARIRRWRFCGHTCASVVFQSVMQHHCLASLCIFSFILCSRSFYVWKMRTTQLQSFATVWLLKKKRIGKGDKAKHYSIKENRSLNMRFFRYGTNPACSSFSQINGLSKPLVKLIHYSSSLLMTILAFEHVSSRLFSAEREYDPYCSAMMPINSEMAKV